jgi:hypothetical protein
MSPPYFASTIDADLAFKPSYMYENVTTHEGDLIIDGYKTLVIENCTYSQNGNIYVVEHGKLIVRNAVLVISSKYPWELAYGILIRDLGFIKVENARITSEIGCALKVDNEGEAYINNSLIEYGGIHAFSFSKVAVIHSNLAGMLIGGETEVTLSNSYVYGEMSIFLEPSHTVKLRWLSPGFYEYWNLHINQTIFNVDYNLTLENTTVEAWHLKIWVYGGDYPNVEVSNSVLSRIELLYRNTKDYIENLKPGIIDYWSFKSITLKNVTISSDHWLVNLGDAEITITNSQIQLITHGKSECSIVNSTIVWLGINQFFGTLSFNRSDSTGGPFYYSSFMVKGDLSFKDSRFPFPWVNTNVTRDYGLVIKDVYGGFMSNVTVILKSKNGTTVWNDITNDEGRANFNVTFTDYNYTDALRLEAVKGEFSGSVNVSFLSNTPLILTLRRHDIAIVNIISSKNVVGQGCSMPISVTVENQGGCAENFNVTVYVNATEIGKQQIITLSNGTSITVNFTWNTAGFAKGNYTINAYTEPVSGEIDTTDNAFTNGWVIVAMIGDIAGPLGNVPDGKVDIRDVAKVARRFGTDIWHPLWDPNCDITGSIIGVPDNKIDIRDIAIVARQFGKTDP